IWPVRPAKVTSGFGMRDGAMHNGLDLSAPKGAPIRAAADGTVIYEGDGLSGYGNLIILDHGGGYTTIYAHNDDNRAALGERVKQGEVIGFVGETGRASNPHCHFEIRRKTRALNPLDYLP
ncbi:MAG: M23 family metallopeptidase, partial [Candidatus Methylomirabilis sp.]|nr:M23 family metallopeptidase [Deltaproteobacteria bacterium]